MMSHFRELQNRFTRMEKSLDDTKHALENTIVLGNKKVESEVTENRKRLDTTINSLRYI